MLEQRSAHMLCRGASSQSSFRQTLLYRVAVHTLSLLLDVITGVVPKGVENLFNRYRDIGKRQAVVSWCQDE